MIEICRVVTGILVYMAVQRLVNNDFDIEAKIMLITSGLGVAINLVMGCTLHQHGHSHGGNNHQHSHSSATNHDAEDQPLLSHNHVGHAHDEIENINVRAGRILLPFVINNNKKKSISFLNFCYFVF
jgi:Co/Zn/Cd efflux system component